MEELEYITQKALMKCSDGGAPGFFLPTYNTAVKINGCVVATAMDKVPVSNIPTFVVCAKTQKPCVPATTMWEDTYPVTVKGQETLLGMSCIQCTIGGKIEFLTSGQVPLTAEEEADINGMRKDVKDAYDEEMKEKNKPWWQKAGEFAVDMIPVVGPVISLAQNVSKGNWGMAALDVGFLALDIVGVVGALETGGGSLVATTAAKTSLKAAVKGAVKATAEKLSKESLKAAAKKTGEMVSKISLRNMTMGKLCVFACFPAGTPVAVKDGYKNIEDIEVGDEVWAWDEATDSVGLKKVTHTLEREVLTLVELTIEGETITTTPEHPFFANGSWKKAGLLQTNDRVQLFTHKQVSIDHVIYTHEKVEAEELLADEHHQLLNIGSSNLQENTKVYNLEVDGWNTYFVGWLKILVHNAGICLKEVLAEIKLGKKKLRRILLGKTPGKNSKTGKEVFERMLKETPPKAMLLEDGTKMFKDSKGAWRNIEEADMAHVEDAVSWWNREGNKYGARSEEVRKWMLDSDNYVLDYYKTNRSEGAQILEKYALPPK